MLLSRLYITSASLIGVRASRQILNRHLSLLAAQAACPFHPHFASFSSAASTSRDHPESSEMSISPYEPFLLSPIPGAERDSTGELAVGEDWTAELELETAQAFAAARSKEGGRLRVLVLYGSLRERSYAKLMAYEASRILHRLGCEVRVYDPLGLPVKDEVSVNHAKVQELRSLSDWSDAHFWSSPEQHGTITAVMKNQIDWIPLAIGSVRPTQGKCLAFTQVNGGSQSFNTVNTLRLLGRWMRMFVIPNQSSLPMAWKAFTPAGRLMPSSNRDRLVDVCEELVKVAYLLRSHEELLSDRYSERAEKAAKGRLLTQAEKEAEKANSL